MYNIFFNFIAYGQILYLYTINTNTWKDIFSREKVENWLKTSIGQIDFPICLR